MSPGFAIDPKYSNFPFGIVGSQSLKIEDIELINVYKCPECGHSDDGE